jgi:hypothetical protein
MWIKQLGSSARVYPAGLTNALVTLGSPYAPPNRGEHVLGITNADIVLIGGPLAEPITNHMTVGNGNKVSSEDGATFSFALPSSTFQGSALDSSHLRIPFAGILLTNMGFGGGYFLDSNQSGRVLLLPE